MGTTLSGNHEGYGFTINDLLNGATDFLGQVGTTLANATATAVGHTHIPMRFKNNTQNPLWLAVYAQFEAGSEAFPTQGWSTQAWFKIAPGYNIVVGDTYSNVYFYLANDDHKHVWRGSYLHSFVDAVGTHHNDMGFQQVTLADNWLSAFDETDVTLNLPAGIDPETTSPATPQSHFKVHFTNHANQQVYFFINGGAGLKTKLAPNASTDIDVAVYSGTPPIVGIYQPNGSGRKDFSIAAGGKYQFQWQGGAIVNAYA
jgi:hypothetical protein